MKISELSEKEKDLLLEQASSLIKDYLEVKDNPENIKNLFKRKIVTVLTKLMP